MGRPVEMSCGGGGGGAEMSIGALLAAAVGTRRSGVPFALAPSGRFALGAPPARYRRSTGGVTARLLLIVE